MKDFCHGFLWDFWEFLLDFCRIFSRFLADFWQQIFAP
jgi:hypothetical protein